MRILQSLSLVVALGICYLLFFRSQFAPEAAPRPTATTSTASSAATVQPRTQYKADIDQAQKVASQMKAARNEADSSF